jgi:hypothetical protein
MKTISAASRLIRDLWSFIENVSEDDPERTDRFFALRERVRDFCETEAAQSPPVTPTTRREP